MKEKHAIGIDVGGTNTKFGIVNKKGVILVQDRIKTNEHENVEEFIDDLAEKLNPMIEQYGGPEAFVGIGMGAPNATLYNSPSIFLGANWPFCLGVANLNLSLPSLALYDVTS
jgi:predicted NBD/HSP70 family sugar kinase